MTITITKEVRAHALKKLIKGGHSIDRANEIIKEAEESSNPEYILHYWGVKN